MEDIMIKTISDTIIWMAAERMKTEHYQNINSAIQSVSIEVSIKLMEFMRDNKEKSNV